MSEPAAAAEREQRVSALELFFDLVFVFAITQVTGFVTAHPDWARLGEAMALLVALWWAWSCYAWLGNTAASDEGLFRGVLFAAMGAMLIASLAVPHAFGRDALAFGAAYAIVRVLHIAAYVVLARGDATLGPVVRGLARSMLPAGLLLLLAGLLDGPGRAACWVAALTLDVGGLLVFGVEGWRVDPAHLGERYGLILIIALGESIVSVGVGAGGLPLHAGTISAALLGMAIAAALWWAYFDVVAVHAQRRFSAATGMERVLIARDSYTYLHLPMVAGIVLFAVGVKTTLAHLGDALAAVPATALCGGLALFFAAMVAFRLRNVGTLNRQRAVTALALAALAPLATAVPALLALALCAALCWGLVAYERLRFGEARRRVRQAA